MPLVCVLLCLACATPIEKSRWVRIESEHFQLISGVSAGESIEIAQRLELLRAVLKLVGLQANLTPRVPLLVYVFAGSESYARFQPLPGMTGFLLPRTHRNFLVVHAGAGEDAAALALHDYVHFVLRNGGATRYPAWYDEGLAEFLSTVSQADGQVVIGAIPKGRERWLLYGSPMSLRQLMTTDNVHDGSIRSLQRFYAQAWTLTHFFHVADRVGFPKRRVQLTDYIARLNQGVPPDEASRQAFGVDFEGLDQEFTQYLAKGVLPYLGLPADRLAIPEQARKLPLPEAERRFLLGDLALALGHDWRGEAEHWFRLAIEADPQNALAHAALAQVIADPTASDAHLARALALAPGDPEVLRLEGDARLARASAGAADAPAQIEAARRAFRRSIALAPDQVAAFAGLGRSFALAPAQGDPQEGLAALETARERLPADQGIALDLAKLELATGSLETARAILTRISPPTHGDPQAAAATATIAELRVEAGLPPQPTRGSSVLASRLVVEIPREGEQVRGLTGLTLARGQGGQWESTLQDVIIAIDESPSTFLPTGSDLDGDGEIGRRRTVSVIGPYLASTDPDDSVIHAELLAARALIRQLDPKTTRVGILAFADEHTLIAPLGPPDAALAWLDEYQVHAYPARTSLAAALDGSLKAFFAFREGDMRRQRTVLLLSDGRPTAPSEALGRREALEAARKLGELGIPVHAYALGQSALESPDFYRGLAEIAGGRFVPLVDPAAVVNELANVRFTGLSDVEIQSAPSGQPGRAVRIFPNGSFDGYVPLAPGENRVTITAVMDDGERLSTTRTVHFERPAHPTPSDELAAQALRENLQDRKVEIELLAEMRRAGPSQVRKLTVDVDPAAKAAGGSPSVSAPGAED